VRIVSLCPSITESLVELGLKEELVGVTRYCIHPREAVAKIPKVGGTKNPDLAAIRVAKPDLVFCNSEENREEDVTALKREFAVDVSHPRTVAEIPALLRRFGRLTGTEERAEEISMKVEKALERVEEEARQRAGGGGASAAFRFVYLIWKDPWMTVGLRTYIADLLRRVGGSLSLEESSAAGAPDYPVTTEDAIVASRPDVLILPDEPYHFRERDAAFWRARLPASTRVVLVSGDDFCWHGVRTVRGLDAAAALGRACASRGSIRPGASGDPKTPLLPPSGERSRGART
jgi:ABC-type Fe3+-hydroxamate transport system substrate-binding protein